ncbi:MAG: tyrosine-type recombinase/integrase [Coriobacteriales bacterium]|nr:tyrosine-type recombinase/integrase [Coriobacteriales bacterium]
MIKFDCSVLNFKQRCVSLFGKGSKQRLVPLHNIAIEALQNYIENGREQLFSFAKNKGISPKLKQENRLFISTRGKPMSADSLRIVFKKRARQAGLDPSFHPHDMRHAFATDLLDAGADLRSVQEMLGHASLSTTQIYTDLSIEHIKKAYNLSHPRAKKD